MILQTQYSAVSISNHSCATTLLFESSSSVDPLLYHPPQMTGVVDARSLE